MADALIPYKAGKIGVAIQTAKGTPAATPTAVYPLPEAGSGINPLKNYSFFNWADNNYNIAHYMSEGEWNEGTITFPIIPGYTLAPTGAVYYWAFDREVVGSYYQTKWATIWREIGHTAERYADCKVITGSIRETAGTFMSLELNVVGITEPVVTAFPAVAVNTGDPYVWSQTVLSLALTGGALATDSYVRDMPINFDNHVVSPSDMLTKRASNFPIDLPSTQKQEVGGSMDRMYLNNALYTDFKAGTEGAIREVWTSGATTCTINLPRVVWTEDPIGIPTEGIFSEDSISWQALGSVDGTTDPMTISEV